MAVATRSRAAESTRIAGRRANPVKWWAFVGAVCLGIWISSWTAWVVSGNFVATPTGPTPLPGYMRTAINIQLVVTVVLFLGCIYWFLVRPWRRDGRLSLDGIMFLALMSMYWQDMLSNFIRPYFLFNTYLPQRGSWFNFLPGVILPEAQRMAQPFLWEWLLYVVYCMPPMLLANYCMRRVKRRWPEIGVFGLMMVAFLTVFVADVTLEVPWLFQGLYVFPGAIEGLTLFHGHYYQFPIYEGIFAGVFVGGFACVRYFTDDKGRCVAEQGIDRVHGTPRQKTALRLLAVSGLFNVIFFFGNNLPLGMIAGLYSDTWPADIVERSYFTNGLCGPGTDYACPGSPSRSPTGDQATSLRRDSSADDHDSRRRPARRRHLQPGVRVEPVARL